MIDSTDAISPLRARLLGATVPVPVVPRDGTGAPLLNPAPTPATAEPGASAAAASPDAGAMVSGLFAGRRTAESNAEDPVDALKRSVHRRVIERLDLAALEQLGDDARVAVQIREAINSLLRDESEPLALAEREQLAEQILHEILGLGPIEPLLHDPTVSDILVNSPRDVYVERGGRLHRTDIRFRDAEHLLSVIDRIVSRVGRRVDESSPMVDARLPDGSRVNAIIPPVAIDSPILSIRRFGSSLGAAALLARGAMSPEMLQLLSGCVRAKLNILVAGGTGSGKTTLLNALSSFIPSSDRVVTIEDAAELRLQQEHVVRLETRPANTENRGEISMRDLVRNALRMRPDRIVIGEVRGAEALDMLQAMNTGHEGSLTTIHANTPRDALARLETIVRYASANLSDRAIREQIVSAVDLIVQASRLSDGTRRVTSITEITGMEGDIMQSQEIFRFHRLGVDPNEQVVGRFEPTGVRPRFAERLAVAGIALPATLFVTNGGSRSA
jgi:pilus assembly protein CpaF